MRKIVDDDVFCTESPTNGRLFYNFERYQATHQLLADAGLIHTLAICAAEIPNHPELVEYIMSRKEEFAFGVHGWNHEKYATWPKEAIVRSLKRAKERIETTFGTTVDWYYPTWNKRSPALYAACQELGLQLNDEWVTLKESEKPYTIRFHSWDDNEYQLLKQYVQR